MTAAGTDKSRSARPWILAATIMASSMVFIDGTAVNVALPVLQRDLRATIVDAQWFVEAYALFLSALILVGGSLGDHFGRKRMFVAGVIGFALASAVCGIAQNPLELILARAAQGMASALLTPGSLSILGASFPPEQRGGAIGIWSSFSAMTGAVGPVLGGLIVEHASWRWIFFINVPLAIATVVVAIRCVPESRDDEPVHHVDWKGALLATLALGSIVYALITAGGTGWTPQNIAVFLIGLALLVVFIVVEARVPSPMMPLRLFANRDFAAVNLMTLLVYGALGGAMFFLPFDLIQVHRYTPTAAGAALLPAIGLIFLLSPWAGRLSGAIGAKIPLVVGSLVTAFALAGLAVPATGGSYWTTFFPAVTALGFGMGLVVSPLTTTVMGSVDPGYFGVASGINNAIARTAGLIAIAALSLAVVAVFNRELDMRLSQSHVSQRVMAAVDEERAQLANAKPPAFTTPEERAAVQQAIAQCYVDGFRVAMLLAAALAFSGSLCAVLFVTGRTKAVSGSVPHSP